MKIYRMNSMMAGVLYFMGTVFGVTGAVVGGEVLSSIVTTKPIASLDLLNLVAANSSQLTGGAFFTFLMGISLVAMTVFLYPIFRKDSEELAAGMLLFRGALEGACYVMSTLSMLVLVALSHEYLATGANSAALQSMGTVMYKFLDLFGPVSVMVFLAGATCLYICFYRTQLIPRWLSIWGMIGVISSMAYAVLHFFHLDPPGVGFYLQMVLAPQEIVMALWLIIKGFDRAAIDRLMTAKHSL